MRQLIGAVPDLYREGVSFIAEITHVSETMVYTAGILFLTAVCLLLLATAAALVWMVVKLILGLIRLLTNPR